MTRHTHQRRTKRTALKETRELAHVAVELERTRNRRAYDPKRWGDKDFWQAAEDTLAGYIDARIFSFFEDVREGRLTPHDLP